MEDRRVLGVMVRRLTWSSGPLARDVPLDDPSLVSGWWATEWHGAHPCRWTDGAALLPAFGRGRLDIELAGTMRYAKTGPAISARFTARRA